MRIQTEKLCVIVGAGDCLPDNLSIPENAFLIAADGGVDILEENNISPDLIIGDGDSVKDKAVFTELYKNTEKIVLPARKDDTDLLAAIRVGMDRGFREFHLYGGFGGERIDHSIANIQCLIFLHQHGCRGYLYSKNSVMTIMEREHLQMQQGHKGYVSLFALDRQVKDVTLRGFSYELEHQALSYDYPVGVSNELQYKQADIWCKEGMLAVIFPVEVAAKQHFRFFSLENE